MSSKFDMPDFDTFKSDMDDPQKRQDLYNSASTEFDMPDYETFSSDMGFKKKEDTALFGEEGNTPSSFDPKNITLSEAKKLLSSGEMENISVGQLLKRQGIEDPDRSIEGRVKEKLKTQTLPEVLTSEKFMSVVNNIGNTTQNIGNSVGIFLNEIHKLSPISRLSQASGFENTTTAELSRAVDENNKQIQVNTVIRSYDENKSFEDNVKVANQGIVDTFEKDGWVAGLGEAGIKAIESSPYVVTAIATGGVGGAAATGSTFFATGYGSSIAESYARDGNVDAIDQSRAILKGIVEGGGSIAFGGISKAGQQMFKGVAREEAKKVLGNNMKNQLFTMFKETSKTAMGEGLEESMQELANYVIDTQYDGEKFNPEKALRLSMDALILGSVSGGAVGGMANTYKYVQAKSLINNDLRDLDAELSAQSTEDNPTKKDMILDARATLIGEIGLKTVSDEDGKKFQDLFFDIKDLESSINSTQTKSIKDAMTDQMNGKIKELNDLTNKYEGDNNRSTKGEEDGELDVQAESKDVGVGGENGSRLGEGGGDSVGAKSVVSEFEQESVPSSDPEIESEIQENIPVDVDIEDGKKWFDGIAKAVQDQSIKLKRVQQSVEKATGKEVFGTESDAYNNLDLEKNKSSAEAKKIISDAIGSESSFVNRASKEGVSFDHKSDVNFGKYLHAKHAKERNARIREIGDEKISTLVDKIDGMYTRLESATDSNQTILKKQISKAEDNLRDLGVSYEMAGSGMSDSESEGILSKMSPADNKSYSKYEKEFRTNFISRLLNDREDAGMIDADLKDRFSIFENYVPLKVAEYESINQSESNKPSRKKVAGARRGLKGIVGADNSLARVDPFIATINELTSLQGDIARNNVFQSFSNMLTETGAEIAEVQVKSGIPKKVNDKYGLAKVEIELPKGFNESNSVRFFEGGKMKFMKINDKDLMNAITQTNQMAPGVYNNFVIRNFAKFFRNVNTTFNPEFMVSNFFRDFQNAAISANLELSDMSTIQFSKEVAKIGGALTKRNVLKFAGKDVSDSEEQQLINEYEASGAKMSWNDLNNIESIGNALESEITNVKIGGITSKPKVFVKKFVEAMELASEIAEHSSRIAAYKLAKEKYTREGDPNAQRKAAILAKEVTVNFNRRGEAGNFLNSLYLFANAGVQGSVRTGEALVKSKKVKGIAFGLFGLGILEGYMNDAFGDDDDEYAQLDEFRKERYYNFKIPGKAIVQVPLPYGWSVFKYAGSKMYEVGKGSTEAPKAFLEVFKSLLTNFAPIGGETAGQLISPTIGDPFVQVSENKNFAGLPIFNEPFGGQEEVRSENSKTNTPDKFKELAESINSLTGGSSTEKGWWDWNPEIYKHYVDTYGGGATRFWGRMAVGGYTAFTGDAQTITIDEIPVIRGFIREIPKRGDSSRVFDMYNKSTVVTYNVKDLEKFYMSVEQAIKKNTLDPEKGLRIIKSFERNQMIKQIADELGVNFDQARSLLQ